MVSASANGYKHVWVVYDTDDFPAEHINKNRKNYAKLKSTERKQSIMLSGQNQCIELWFLLHFNFMQSNLHRSSYWPKTY